MAVGKNKKLGKKGAKKKKLADPFTKKDWYDIKAPSYFAKRNQGKTPVNKTQGVKTSEDALNGRVVELNLADLQNDTDLGHQKVYLTVESTQGSSVLTNFHGMEMTRDKLCSLMRKWQSTIEANVDFKTQDGYTLRMFCIAFAKKQSTQMKKTAYTNSAQSRKIRAKMRQMMVQENQAKTLKEFVRGLTSEYLGKEIEKKCNSIFPIHSCYIRKVKVLKKPKFDLVKLMEVHEKSDAADGGAAMAVGEEDAAKNTLTADVQKAAEE